MAEYTIFTVMLMLDLILLIFNKENSSVTLIGLMGVLQLKVRRSGRLHFYFIFLNVIVCVCVDFITISLQMANQS